MKARRDVLVAAAGLILLGFAVAGCWRWALKPGFRGELRVTKGTTESLAIEPNTRGSSSVMPAGYALYRGVTGRQIPFANSTVASHWLNPDRSYNVLKLPFGVHLNRITILKPGTERTFLGVRAPGASTEQRSRIRPNTSVKIGNRKVRVKAIRPWAGLIRNPEGGPSASVAVRMASGQWLENLFLSKGSWLEAGVGLALHMDWHNSERKARAAAHGPAPGLETAQWGAVDGAGMDWLDSFVPGTGTQLNNGVVVTLAQVDLHHATPTGSSGPAVQLKIVRGGASKLRWVMANDPTPNAPYRFEYPAARDMVFVLHAWQDGSCVVSAYQRHRLVGPQTISEGDSWTPKGTKYTIRLDQLMSTGIPVSAKESLVDEVVLDAPSQTLRIREGETFRWHDFWLRFIEETTPPKARYELTLVNPKDMTKRRISLEPGGHFDANGVSLSTGTPVPKMPAVAVVNVESRKPRILLALAGLLVVLGVFLLLWNGFRRRLPGGLAQ